MASNIGKTINNFYCNGYAGRRYDLAGSTVEAEGHDYLVLRTSDGKPVFMNFPDGENIDQLVDKWQQEEPE